MVKQKGSEGASEAGNFLFLDLDAGYRGVFAL